MAQIRKKKIGERSYYYLEHRYKIKGKIKSINKYLGKKIPENIGHFKEEVEWKALREAWFKDLPVIRKSYSQQLAELPQTEKDKFVEDFVIHFIYDSSKIEGNSLTYKDTLGLFLHGATPKNKPIKDVNESEGYRKSFYSMLEFKGNLGMSTIRQWHAMIFKESNPLIAGKIRKHKIMVTGSNVSFPHPESLGKLLKEFTEWFNANEKKLNPVELAALAHLKFVSIHPFSDGNGRISRLLANFVLHKHKYPMFNVKFSDRMAYYDSLKESQLWNDKKKFVRFFIKKYINQHKKFLK